MKGIVFALFGEMIEQKLGFEGWDALIEATGPPSRGVYVSTETYDDAELIAYLATLSERSGKSPDELNFIFGQFLMERFAAMHPVFFEGHTLVSFLKSIHDVIHIEVTKLHPDVVMPAFDYEDAAEGLVMLYHSPRRLCSLAEGLITGAGRHFNEAVAIGHPECMKHGALRCRLELTIGVNEDENAA